jgi:hypothetical protein
VGRGPGGVGGKRCSGGRPGGSAGSAGGSVAGGQVHARDVAEHSYKLYSRHVMMCTFI